ncbi:uncharacterized protein BT62DRAFT_938520 [Guyanagaster necrorhizus]|uniref:Uncharacterized protein n=1 Tax=Guyanagaster necrorhizus TaxID=856835 RepID=A0A9P8ALR9_9AGAR|nr:uncharacterized protein BT62DRAFT_938520 [Guyanagaster necrorhizus MCA 3950]KAG7439926.1 hypothetical protein BT62DRAFT_938520 [Guyanagaster necrorhizus MCA 3950]
MRHHINIDAMKSRIQGYLQDDTLSLHSPASLSNHVGGFIAAPWTFAPRGLGIGVRWLYPTIQGTIRF